MIFFLSQTYIYVFYSNYFYTLTRKTKKKYVISLFCPYNKLRMQINSSEFSHTLEILIKGASEASFQKLFSPEPLVYAFSQKGKWRQHPFFPQLKSSRVAAAVINVSMTTDIYRTERKISLSWNTTAAPRCSVNGAFSATFKVDSCVSQNYSFLHILSYRISWDFKALNIPLSGPMKH